MTTGTHRGSMPAYAAVIFMVFIAASLVALPCNDAIAQCLTLTSGDCREETTVPIDYQFNQPPWNYWMLVGVTPSPYDDKDINLYPMCGAGTPLAGSNGTSGADFIVGDFNHNAFGTYYPRTSYGATGSAYHVAWTQGGSILPAGAVRVGNFHGVLSPCTDFAIWDAWLQAGHQYEMRFSSGSREAGASLFYNPGATAFWTGRTGSVVELLGAMAEQTYVAPATDWYGMVVFSKWNQVGDGTYSIEVEPMNDCQQLLPGVCATRLLYTPEGNDNFSFQQTNRFWSAVALVPADNSMHLAMYTACDDEGELLTNDGHLVTETALVVADFNENPLGTYYPVAWGAPAGTSFTIDWAGTAEPLQVPGTAGGNMSTGASCNLVDVRDVILVGGNTYKFTFATQGTGDMRTALYHNAGTTYWSYRGSAEFELSGPLANMLYTAPVTDYYGVVTFANTPETVGAYGVQVELANDCVPLSSDVCSEAATLPGDFSLQQTARYWTAVSVVPASDDDKDIYIYDQCDGGGTLLQTSTGATGADFIVGDFNHIPIGTYYPRVTYGYSFRPYSVQSDTSPEIFPIGPVMAGSLQGAGAGCGQLRIWDVYLEAGVQYAINFACDGPADVRAALFHNPGNGVYWAGRMSSQFELTTSTSMTYVAPATDWYGLVVFANQYPALGSYWLRILRADQVTDIGPAAPAHEFALHANVPNPFNPETMIHYALPRAGEVHLEVFDVAGRRVRSLVHGTKQAGEQQVPWDGRDDGGQAVASGVYVVRLAMEDRIATRKVVLLK